eukprot:gene10468-3151_t
MQKGAGRPAGGRVQRVPGRTGENSVGFWGFVSALVSMTGKEGGPEPRTEGTTYVGARELIRWATEQFHEDPVLCRTYYWWHLITMPVQTLEKGLRRWRPFILGKAGQAYLDQFYALALRRGQHTSVHDTYCGNTHFIKWIKARVLARPHDSADGHLAAFRRWRDARSGTPQSVKDLPLVGARAWRSIMGKFAKATTFNKTFYQEDGVGVERVRLNFAKRVLSVGLNALRGAARRIVCADEFRVYSRPHAPRGWAGAKTRRDNAIKHKVHNPSQAFVVFFSMFTLAVVPLPKGMSGEMWCNIVDGVMPQFTGSLNRTLDVGCALCTLSLFGMVRVSGAAAPAEHSGYNVTTITPQSQQHDATPAP